MSTIYTLIAGRILAANPAHFVPQFNASNQNGTTYTNPAGTYRSLYVQEQQEDGTFQNAYRQSWYNSTTGIMMKGVGTALSDLIEGGDGNDVLLGDAGKDQIIGGGGNDIIVGGGGTDDWLYGQFGSNTIIGGYVFADPAGTYFIDSWKTMFNNCTTEAQFAAKFVDVGGNVKATGANGIDYILTGSGNDRVVGLGGDDILYSGNGDDTVVGDAYNGLQGWDGTQGGDDFIDAGAGNDTVMGNAGNDTNYGGAGNDTLWGDTDPSKITLVTDTGDDTIYGGAGEDSIHGGAGNDYIDAGADDDTVYGDAGNDTIYGDAGNDSIDAGTDNDIIYGDAGNDTIYGGVGNDTIYGGAGRIICTAGPATTPFTAARAMIQFGGTLIRAK
jgi:Ca2+-binding RTX toxin-like protein